MTYDASSSSAMRFPPRGRATRYGFAARLDLPAARLDLPAARLDLPAARLDLPAALLALVLLLEPLLQRCEVLEDRGRIHLALTGELGERVLPRARRTELEHVD